MTRPTRLGRGLELTDAASIEATYYGDNADWETSPLTPEMALDNLTDVTAPTPDDGDGIVWDDYLGAWINAHALTEDDVIALITPDILACAIVAVIDGGGSAITTGVKLDLRIPFACTLTGWTLQADPAGAIVIDVWRDTYANFPPTDADALPGGGKEPTIAATNAKAEDMTITDWTSDDLVAGDCLRFNVDSCTTITRATLTLYATRT